VLCAAGIVLRVVLLKLKSKAWFDNTFMPYFGPCALLGLLYTTLIMFAAQDILGQVGNVARVAVPMLLYFLAMFAVSLALSVKLRASYAASVTQAFTAASNNFELAIAVAVGTFGITSQEALAATVGPLIEVPVLLGLVYVALWIKPKFWREPGAEDEELKAVEATAAGQSPKDATTAAEL
jgi:ACR3 family arsenite transporter